MIAVCVTFDIKAEHRAAFMPLMHAQAKNTMRAEPDCHQFDVCAQSDAPNRLFLYEVYTDRAAFDMHLASDHFKVFDAAVGEMIAMKSVQIFDDISRG